MTPSKTVHRNYNPTASFRQHRAMVRQSTATMYGALSIHVIRFIVHWTAVFMIFGLDKAIYDTYYSCEATESQCGGRDEYGTLLTFLCMAVLLTNSFRTWFDRMPRRKDEVTARMRTAFVWATSVLIVVQAARYMDGVNGVVVFVAVALGADIAVTAWLRRAHRKLAESLGGIRSYNYVPHAERRRWTR